MKVHELIEALQGAPIDAEVYSDCNRPTLRVTEAHFLNSRGDRVLKIIEEYGVAERLNIAPPPTVTIEVPLDVARDYNSYGAGLRPHTSTYRTIGAAISAAINEQHPQPVPSPRPVAEPACALPCTVVDRYGCQASVSVVGRSINLDCEEDGDRADLYFDVEGARRLITAMQAAVEAAEEQE